jgi:predicted RNA-binding Zn-ribbon protein involved in translation (DUF1610 family)
VPISFACPNCGLKLKAPESAVGKSSACPRCNTVVICPPPIYDAELIGEAGGEEHFETTSAYSGAASPNESRHPCPMCGELIVTGAAKCRFCDEVFDPALRTSKAKKKSRKYWPEDEQLSGLEMVLGALCSGIGCIFGLIWMIQGKPKGLKMVGVAIVADVVKYALIAVFELIKNRAP